MSNIVPYKLKKSKKSPSKQKEIEEAINDANSFRSAVHAGALAASVHDNTLNKQAQGRNKRERRRKREEKERRKGKQGSGD